MASIRTHNNRHRSKARSPERRQIDRARTYVRQYRRVYGGLKKWLKGKMFHDGGTITGRVPRDPEWQHFPPRRGLNLQEAVMPMTLMTDYGDLERRMAHHMSARRLGDIIVDAPSEAEVLDTLDRKVDIYEELSEKLKMPRVDIKDNLMGLMYGMSPGKAAQNKVKKNG